MLTYKEYPGLKTYVVIHTEGTGEQGGNGIQDREIIGSFDTIEEAREGGNKLYPAHPSEWGWDNYRWDINTLTEIGKELYKEFQLKVLGLVNLQELYPELYKSFPLGDGSTITLKHFPELDSPFK